MASTINASTTGGGGVITTADASGSLALQGAGNTGLTIDSSGNATATTQSQANNSTRLATTAYVDRTAVQQVVFSSTTSYASGSTSLPYDNTIPQNTEGDQYMTATITPKSATSKLVIHVVGVFWTASANAISGALFQDSTANALAVSYCYAPNANNGSTITINYSMTSGTTSATTFKFRAGANGVQTIYFNGTNGSGIFNGTCMSSIMIMEVGV